MRSLFLLLGLLVLSPPDIRAGVGGITGGHIHFQSDSTFVSAVCSKTLCLDRDRFHAVINKCVARVEQGAREGECLRTEKAVATQPMNSTRMRCEVFSGTDQKTCAKWVEVPYVQKPVLEVNYVDKDNRIIDRKTVVVPACR